MLLTFICHLSVEAAIPSWASLPSKLAETKYTNPSDSMQTAFQQGLRTDSHFFQWLAQRPELLQNFNTSISHQEDGHDTWLDVYPFEEKFEEKSVDAHQEPTSNVLIVDVGGAKG